MGQWTTATTSSTAVLTTAELLAGRSTTSAALLSRDKFKKQFYNCEQVWGHYNEEVVVGQRELFFAEDATTTYTWQYPNSSGWLWRGTFCSETLLLSLLLLLLLLLHSSCVWRGGGWIWQRLGLRLRPRRPLEQDRVVLLSAKHLDYYFP